MMNIMKNSTIFALLTFLALVSYSLQAPVQSEEDSAASTTTVPSTGTQAAGTAKHTATTPNTTSTTATAPNTNSTAPTTASTVTSTTATSPTNVTISTSEHTVTTESTTSTVPSTATAPTNATLEHTVTTESTTTEQNSIIPTQIIDFPTEQDSTTSSSPTTSSTIDEVTAMPLTSCPGYEKGNPTIRNKTGCETGSSLEGVDHRMAFGFHGGSNPDWSSCDLPQVPEENQRICYKTTVDKCGNDYRIFLNKRNIENLQQTCPSESIDIITSTENATDRLFQSPRYRCRKGRGSGALYKYRRSDFCMYNISIPNCESGWLTIDSAMANDREIEQRMKADDEFICTDYLQFFYGNTRTQKFCDNDLTLMLPLHIPATQFLAIFWTDPSTNEDGFEIRARCRQLT